jgi:Double-GTPase 1
MTTTQVLAGIPDSGKTTFVAALRYCLVSGEVETVLELVRFSQNETHLNTIEEKWVACEQVERTKEPTSAWVRFHVRDKASGAESEILLPDLLGEAFRQPAATGRCRRSLYDAMVAADGMILFTNAARGIDDLMINEVGDVLDALADGTEASEPSEPKKFDPEDMPEEAHLVELLQVINRRPQSPRMRQLAVIISAWDVAEADALAPEAWLSAKRPMLAQFLEHNSDLWETRVFGVSAQGGVLPRDCETLRGLKPSLKTKVVGPGAAEHDLSATIYWAMARESKP